MNTSTNRKLPSNTSELRAEFNHCADRAISGGEHVWARNLLKLADERGYRAEAIRLRGFLAFSLAAELARGS